MRYYFTNCCMLFSCLIAALLSKNIFAQAVILPSYGMTPAQADIYQQNRQRRKSTMERENNDCAELGGVMGIIWGMSQNLVERTFTEKGGRLIYTTNYLMKFENIYQAEILTDSVVAYFKNDYVYSIDFYYPNKITNKFNLNKDAQNIFSDVRALLMQKYYPPQYTDKFYKKEEYKKLTYSGELDKINDGNIDLYYSWAFDKNCEVKNATMNLPTIQCNYSNIYLEIRNGMVKCTYNDSKYSVENQRKVYKIMKDAIDNVKKKQTDDF